MAWCETNRVDFMFGLARNERLEPAIKSELMLASLDSIRSGRPARRFRDFMWSTLDSWSRNRRVVGKAEVTGGEANPRFVVTSLKSTEIAASISTRRSTAPAARWRTGSRNASLICSLTAPRPPRCAPISFACGSPQWPTCCLRLTPHRSRAIAVRRRDCGTIRLKLLKIGALVRLSVRRIKVAMSSACPWQNEFALAHVRLRHAAT